MSQQKRYPRFSVPQRIEHWVLFASFTALAITGLPQKFVGIPWAENMIAAMGGIEQVRIWHHYAAFIIMALTIYHGAAVTYKIVVQRVQFSMMVGLQDLKDLFGVMANNLGLSKARPRLPRYNFEEKMEYWAVVWGTVIMAITGFMLWNPIATAKFLPGSFIPAAKAAHGGEALLAVLAIIVWHLYGVIIREMNPSMFTGKLSRKTMAHEHALELEQIDNNTLLQKAPIREQAKRRRIFVPAATVIVIVFSTGLYWFTTLEDTAPVATAAENPSNSPFQPVETETADNIHLTIAEYSGPESCAAAGCHNAQSLETASVSTHNQRIAVAGPNPLLAKLVTGDAFGGDVAPDCLVCHAQNYQADNLLASAHTIQPAGGQACLRCHSDHPEEDVHNEVGLACVSCHTSDTHQMNTEVSCADCHAEIPAHQDPLINAKHQRLDCRTCHVQNDVQVVVDTGQPEQDTVLAFFKPAAERLVGEPSYAWHNHGRPSLMDNEKAFIVPVVPITLLAPANLDPVVFAQNGSTDGPNQETSVYITSSHGITKDKARTCDTCHGPDGSFDFAGLGYSEEQVDNLLAKPAPPPETE